MYAVIDIIFANVADLIVVGWAATLDTGAGVYFPILVGLHLCALALLASPAVRKQNSVAERENTIDTESGAGRNISSPR